MDALTLSPAVLDWAARKAGESLESLAESVSKRDSDRKRILRGELTVAQAEKIAQRARVPFGLLFLEEPPQLLRPTIPDLRQTLHPAPLSEDFFEVLADVLGKQAWYLEHLRHNGAEPLPFVGRYRFEQKPTAEAIAQNIRTTLGLSDVDRRRSATPEDYFSAISEKAEAVGVLVMKNGVVKSNTRRALSEKEFRGFALADELAPVVFVNGRDAEVAAVFTLGHELAHIWFGESGVSDVFSLRSKGLERACNQVATELLVPRDAFLAQWKNTPDIQPVARHFRVSRFVAGLRALALGKIMQDEFDALIQVKLPPKSRSGGDGLRTIPVRNSKRLTRALVNSTLRGETLIRDAARLLNVRADTVMSLGREFSRRA